MGEICNSGSKLTQAIRDTQEKKIQERKRNILHLILSYLKEHNLDKTVESLTKEAFFTPGYQLCDNIDLDTILQEYTSYYHTKFGKYPNVTKKVAIPENVEKKKITKPVPNRSKTKIITPPVEEFDIRVMKLPNLKLQLPEDNSPNFNLDSLECFEGATPEWKEMYEVVSKEIIPKSLGVAWIDCIGLDHVKTILEEAVVFPVKYPDVFLDIVPWKSILLYGPPGTGKTLVAKALACETNNIFINVAPSTFVSKWRGDSEKLVKVLFEVAKKCAPSIIFIDELDAIASKREDHQHEASRRFKSELLTQLDGILNCDQKIFVLATTNLPWEVDSALLRRFDKKIYVGLPDLKSRDLLFEKYFNLATCPYLLQMFDTRQFALATEKFSGSDIQLICKNVMMSCVRQRIDIIKSGSKKGCLKLCVPSNEDVKHMISNARPSCRWNGDKYEEWKETFGGF